MFSNKPMILAAAVLFLLAVVRVPVPDGQFRAMFRLIAEAGVLFAVAGLVGARVNAWAGMFLALVVASWVFQPEHGRISLIFRDYWLFLVAWYVVVALSEKPAWFFNVIAVIATINVIFLASQWCGSGWAGIIKLKLGHPIGLMANKNETGALIAMSIPAFLRPGWKKFLGIPILGVVLAKSTVPALAACVGLGLWCLYESDPVFVLPALATGLLCFCFWDTGLSGAISARLEIWAYAWDKFWLCPWFGAGIGHWSVVARQLNAHNDFWQLTFEMGLLLPIIVLGYAVSTIRWLTADKLLPFIGVVVAGACSAFSFTAHVATTAVVAATWMGLLSHPGRAQT